MAGKGRILVVDDDRLVLATLAHGLTQAGYEVTAADNGDDAILLARERLPQLALLDIRMEGKSGFDVAAYLREALQVPFMFLSAFSDEATLQQVRALGAIDYLVKPLDIAQIVPAVDAALVKTLDHARGPATVRSAPQPVVDVVSIAVGVLMHRYSLPRAHALARLQRQASESGQSLNEHAERLVQAVELLAGTGSIA